MAKIHDAVANDWIHNSHSQAIAASDDHASKLKQPDEWLEQIDINSNNIANIRILHREKKARISSLWTTVLVTVMSIVLAIVDIELVWWCHADREGCDPGLVHNVSMALKTINSLLTIILCGLVASFYVSSIRIRICEDPDMKDFKTHNLALWWHSELRIPLLVEIMVCLLHVPPIVFLWTDATDENYYFIAVPRMTTVVVVRLYLIPRLMRYNSRLICSAKLQFLAKMNCVQITYLLMFKIHLYKRPYKILLSTLAIFVLFVPYIVEVFERSEDHGPVEVSGDYYFRWCWSIGGMTLGMEPSHQPASHIGRTLEVLTATVALVLLAILITVVSNTLELDPLEQKMLKCLDENDVLIEKQLKGVVLIQTRWRYRCARIAFKAQKLALMGHRHDFDITLKESLQSQFVGLRLRLLHACINWKDVKLRSAAVLHQEEDDRRPRDVRTASGVKESSAMFSSLNTRVSGLERTLQTQSEAMEKMAAQLSLVAGHILRT